MYLLSNNLKPPHIARKNATAKVVPF